LLTFPCVAIPTLVELGLGVIYFSASEVMPYHQEVVGVDWADVAPGARTMLIALAKPNRTIPDSSPGESNQRIGHD
jgi:hypothetical protein